MLSVNNLLAKVPMANEVLGIAGSLWKGLAYSILPLLLAFYQFNGAILFLLVMASLFGVIYFAQDILLYHNDNPPNSRLYVQSLSHPNSKNMGFESVQMVTEDYVTLHGYLLKVEEANPQNYPTIVYVHGNAGNIGHRLPNATEMVVKLGCNVLLVEYRGYGKSTGTPSEQGLYLDVKAAITFIKYHVELNESPIILFGRSLGGAVAIQAATTEAISKLNLPLITSSTSDHTTRSSSASSSVHGVILGGGDGSDPRVAMLVVENTFTHIADIAEVMFQIPGFSYIPRFFYKNKFPSIERMSRVEIPSLFISGQADQLVPPHMMSNLFSRCAAAKKRLLKVRGGTHNETWMTSGYYDSIKKFMDEVFLNAAPGSTSPNSKTFRPNGKDDSSAGGAVGGSGANRPNINSPMHSLSRSQQLPSVAIIRENETSHDNLHFPASSDVKSV